MRKLAIVLLVLAAIPLVHYFVYEGTVVRPAGAAAVSAVAGVDLAAELGKKIPVDSLLGGVRTLSGNAAHDYQKALMDNEAKEEELPLVESGAQMQECLFTSVLFHIPDNLVELEIPRLAVMRKFGKMMMEKAGRLEESGDITGAERELQWALSVGNHLELEYTYISYAVGLSIQKDAAEAMQAFYDRQGRPDRAGECKAYASEISRLIDAGKRHLNQLYPLDVSDNGRRILKQLYDSPNVSRGLKGEIIFANSSNYLFYHTGILYGPPAGRRAFREELMATSDPVLKELADKSKFLLDMNIRQRFQSIQYVATIE